MRRIKAGGICTSQGHQGCVLGRDSTTLFEKRKMLHGELPQELSKLLLIQMNSLHFISSGDGTVKPQGTTVHMENYTCFGLLIKVRPQMLTPYILIQRYTYFKVREIMIFSTSKMSDQMHVDSQHYHHEAPKK